MIPWEMASQHPQEQWLHKSPSSRAAGLSPDPQPPRSIRSCQIRSHPHLFGPANRPAGNGGLVARCQAPTNSSSASPSQSPMFVAKLPLLQATTTRRCTYRPPGVLQNAPRPQRPISPEPNRTPMTVGNPNPILQPPRPNSHTLFQSNSPG